MSNMYTVTHKQIRHCQIAKQKSLHVVCIIHFISQAQDNDICQQSVEANNPCHNHQTPIRQ